MGQLSTVDQTITQQKGIAYRFFELAICSLLWLVIHGPAVCAVQMPTAARCWQSRALTPMDGNCISEMGHALPSATAF